MKLSSMSKARTFMGWLYGTDGVDPSPYLHIETLLDKHLRRMLGQRKPFRVLGWDLKPPYPEPDLIIGYRDQRIDARLVHFGWDAWVVSIKSRNGKPAGLRVVETIKALAEDLDTPVDASCLPKEWQFERRNVNSIEFTEYFPDSYWLHTFFYVLAQELEQSSKMDRTIK